MSARSPHFIRPSVEFAGARGELDASLHSQARLRITTWTTLQARRMTEKVQRIRTFFGGAVSGRRVLTTDAGLFLVGFSQAEAHKWALQLAHDLGGQLTIAQGSPRTSAQGTKTKTAQGTANPRTSAQGTTTTTAQGTTATTTSAQGTGAQSTHFRIEDYQGRLIAGPIHLGHPPPELLVVDQHP
jgi:hypothetical protein